jgi:hypothetical protein
MVYGVIFCLVLIIAFAGKLSGEFPIQSSIFLVPGAVVAVISGVALAMLLLFAGVTLLFGINEAHLTGNHPVLDNNFWKLVGSAFLGLVGGLALAAFGVFVNELPAKKK